MDVVSVLRLSFPIMIVALWSFLLLPSFAEGSKPTTCEVADGNTLNCKFSENINSTRTDFAVYFYPDSGGEEKLVDCGWIEDQLHCIRQQGFICKQPVSDNAVITVPTRFVNKTGSYRCRTDGYNSEEIKPCNFSGKQATEHFSACDTNTTLPGPQVILNCTFSFSVDSFSVKQNSTVVASFKKSECQSSGLCRHVPGDSQDTFSIKLEMPDYPYGEYLCHPDNKPSSGLKVNGCSVNMKSRAIESALTPIVLPVALSIVCVLILVTTITVLCIRRRNSVRKKRSREITSVQLKPILPV